MIYSRENYKKKADIKLSVIVPCLNEIDNIKPTQERLKKVCDKLVNDKYEILFVDGGSTDGTKELIKHLCNKCPYTIGIILSRNFDQQTATTAGMYYSSGETVLIIDADLQDPPEILPKMFEKMKEGYDVVYGKRAERYGESILYKACCWIYYKLAKIFSDIEIPENTGDFRLIKREIVDLYLSIPESPRSLRSIFPWLGFNQIGIEYKRDERNLGKTKYHFLRMINTALNSIINSSNKILYTGFFFGLLLFIVGIFFIFQSLFTGNSITKQYPDFNLIFFTFLFSINFIFMFLIGRYISNISESTKGRPLFIVDKIHRYEENNE